ncbi:hypothetical protein PUNSTDRAFT_125276 [Punctularia strigosozonata HHB-11173 SS5]|uniref:uncharacterized protein n=1 Tax=Punctularia strigosozonata (strain HHB-11173) TaxID=741275 RepID=UPI00044167EF|nr:uncharacterized protein PUNSTDRAFT_125276 [Punctularia strigosozonata HHB-11173 SS5]EIN10407.1 hypothetical protein PUNSTDRAFT_125276 [Punctularia strigosozonata HHB-11173 SS5]
MSGRYAPLPNPRADPDASNEMEAAFDDSDDEGEQAPLAGRTVVSNHPLVDNNDPSVTATNAVSAYGRSPPAPGTYDFENVDYDYPPPGSPPAPSDRALPNSHGNSNGIVPSASSAVAVDTYRGPPRGWFGRTAAAVLPAHYVTRFGLDRERLSTNDGSERRRVVGGGTQNDGVFANVTAKPTAPRRVQEGDETYLVPEEAQKDAPPSYQAAQLDAVPPYWETTVHLPSSANSPGEVMIDGLSTGSLFSFLWNMLVSVSFQFVGFLLTYLLHTTHAARLGSRAGLGVTLIQYGFALRSRADSWATPVPSDSSDPSLWSWDTPSPSPPAPSFDTAKEAEDYYNSLALNGTDGALPSDDYVIDTGDTPAAWLAFALMTVGWFVLLTSLLGFWRVKRWEAGILASPAASSAPAASSQPRHPLARVFDVPGLSGRASLLSRGLGLDRLMQHRQAPTADVVEDIFAVGPDDEDEVEDASRRSLPGHTQFVIPVDESDPERTRQIVQAYAAEERLHRDLRAAGLL